jgi:hypothetical protein
VVGRLTGSAGDYVFSSAHPSWAASLDAWTEKIPAAAEAAYAVGGVGGGGAPPPPPPTQ